MRSLFLLLLLALALPTWAQDYDVYRPPNVITANRIESIRIVTKAEMELGDLPAHPKITWLGTSSVRLPNNFQGEMQTNNQIDFIANSPGLIEFPPIPIVLENKEFFIRIGEIRVEKNTASKTETSLRVLWNNQEEIPAQVHLGEAVEVTFLEMVELSDEDYSINPYFSEPSNQVAGGQWHQYVRFEGRKPVPSDYFFTYSQGFFSRFGQPENYRENTREIEGKTYEIRSYKARLYFTKTGTASGHLSATLGSSRSSNSRRTHVLPFAIEVLPIPPLPNDQAHDTGLIGDWQFETAYRPIKPQAAQPFKIDVRITGQGNPNLRNDFDFSDEGFPSVESNLYAPPGTNYDFWEAEFTQTLLPTGKVGTLPAITLASFDTVADQWRFQDITPSLTLPGFTDATASLTPRLDLGPAITRPVLLNLPLATFGAFALAPFLPFFFGFAKRRLDARDPEQKARERTLKKLIADFQSGQGAPEAIDTDLLPILRHHLGLPSGATTREVAEALDDPALTASLIAHAESSFSSSAQPVDLPALARQLGKITLVLLATLLSLPKLHGNTLEEANAAFESANYRDAIAGYQSLIEANPNRAALHINLAQAQLAANDPARARAAIHTALLLDPLDGPARELLSEIRERQGDLTVSRYRFLDLRPDQWILLAALLWILCFLVLGLRKFRPLPLWPALVLGALALVLLGTAAWRQTHDYASDQYMVLAAELPREPTAGTPDWNYPALRAGQIVRIAEINETHARVQSSESSFWLPVNELQQVW